MSRRSLISFTFGECSLLTEGHSTCTRSITNALSFQSRHCQRETKAKTCCSHYSRWFPGTVVTALFSRGPWLYVRIDSSGKTGYIPRIICSVSHHRMLRTNHQQPQQHYQHHLSVSSTDSSSLKDEELDLTKLSLKTASLYRHAASKAPINRYLSHSSAIITDTHPKLQDQSKRCLIQIAFDERERRNTYTLPRPPRSSLTSAKDRRLTVSSLQCSTSASQQESLDTHQFPDTSTNAMPTRDTDSSSTQDSGYSESTPYILVQQLTPETERSTSYSLRHRTNVSRSIDHLSSFPCSNRKSTAFPLLFICQTRKPKVE